MSSSNCCFLTCIQVSQEAGQMVWYSHLFQNFSQFIVMYTVKGFGIINKAEIDVFLELSCFFHDPADVGNLISGSSAFSKTSLNISKFTVHVLLKPWLGEFWALLYWWQYTALMYSFSYLEPVCCSMSSSNCCFLTCIQISREAGQVLWDSHLFEEFSTVYCDPNSQRLWHSQ